MDDLDRLETKVDKIVDDISEIKVTLTAQHVTLIEHIKRSAANEKAIKVVAAEVAPIQMDRAKAKFMIKVIGWVITMALSSEVLYHVIFKN